jgi:hypothetical protein
VTRDELLASVHALEPGDVLFVRLDRPSVDAKTAAGVAAAVQAKVPTGVGVLVGGRDITLEQYRRVSEPEVAATPQ